MRIAYLSTPGLLAVTMIMLIGPSSEAQEGRISGPAARPGSEAEPGQRARGTPFGTGMLPSAEILSAQFQATVYEVQAAAERLGTLDDKVLTRQAATPETLLATLARTGKARLLYRIEQPVNVFSTRIIIGSSEPIITGTATTATGGTVNSISYQTLGFIVGLSAQAPPKDQHTAAPIVTTAIKFSVLSPGEKEIAPDQKESVIRMMSLDHSAALELMRPQVVLAISSNAFSSFRRSAEGNHRAESPATPVAYVIRYQFGPPAQSSADGAPQVRLSKASCRRCRWPHPKPRIPPTPSLPNSRRRFTQWSPPPIACRRWISKPWSARARPSCSWRPYEAGKPKVLYRIDQPVNVFSDEVLIMTNKPIVTATRRGRMGSRSIATLTTTWESAFGYRPSHRRRGNTRRP